MKTMKILAMCILACLAFAISASATSRSEEEFLEQFKAALSAKNEQGVLALCCLDDAPDVAKASLKAQIDDILTRVIDTVAIEDIPAAKRAKIETGRPYQGKRLVNNIPLVKQLKITFKEESGKPVTGVTLLIGKKGDEHLIAASKLLD
jgi:hypothetical protein